MTKCARSQCVCCINAPMCRPFRVACTRTETAAGCCRRSSHLTEVKFISPQLPAVRGTANAGLCRRSPRWQAIHVGEHATACLLAAVWRGSRQFCLWRCWRPCSSDVVASDADISTETKSATAMDRQWPHQKGNTDLQAARSRVSHTASDGALVRSAWLAITLLPVKALRASSQEQLSTDLTTFRPCM